jgi:hypothetical protein
MKRRNFLLIIGFLLILFSGNLSAQKLTAKDYILVNDDVRLKITLTSHLDRDEVYRRVHHYLDNDFQPYIGNFLIDTAVYTRCKITDYIGIRENAFDIFAMYMAYDMSIHYADSLCVINIGNMRYMEKPHYEYKEEWEKDPKNRKLNMPEFSGKEMLIKHDFKRLFVSNAAKKVETATLDRFNDMRTHIRRYLNQINFDEEEAEVEE